MYKTLNPCPFCGGTAEIRMVGDDKKYFTCVCSRCGKTPVHFDEAQPTSLWAIKIWNRRCSKYACTCDTLQR